jgi:hypothetical protein
MSREVISPYQVVDLAQMARIESEITELTNIRNNLPKEHWAYLEGKIADKRAELDAVRDAALERQRTAKEKMVKAILVCDYITDVAEQFADASKKMTHSGEAGDTFRQMVKSCSDRHDVCMREWNEIVRCIDSKGRKVGDEYAEVYDRFNEFIDPYVDEFIERLKKEKFWRKI